jgi:AcrR family transcriptional regulator
MRTTQNGQASRAARSDRPSPTGRRTAVAPASPGERPTRERVLDVALELFVEQGYDKTSLREVAEKIGFTKAALYYHFPSKADMLGALHERMHSLMDKPMAVLGDGPVTLERFERFLDVCLDEVAANQKLFLLHRVNQAALAKMHVEGHGSRREDMEERARKLFSDPTLPEADRVRMAAAFSSAMVVPMIITGWFPATSNSTAAATLKQVVHEVLRPGPRRRPAPSKSQSSQ